MKILKKSWIIVGVFVVSCVFMFNGGSVVLVVNVNDFIVFVILFYINLKDFKVFVILSNFMVLVKIDVLKIGLFILGVMISLVIIVKFDEKNNVNGEYCKVLGVIYLVDKIVLDINF